MELQEAVAIENAEGKGSWLELFSRKGHMWKRTMNGMMIQFFQQMSAQNFYYYCMCLCSLRRETVKKGGCG